MAAGYARAISAVYCTALYWVCFQVNQASCDCPPTRPYPPGYNQHVTIAMSNVTTNKVITVGHVFPTHVATALASRGAHPLPVMSMMHKRFLRCMVTVYRTVLHCRYYK